ncbi:MAG: superoxide dismutase [Saprospiraceae bacterium]|nr:superoxide dismutase [Saprospiraceae bacterium]
MKKLILPCLALLASLFAQAQNADPFSLPKLDYAYDALEPSIDAKTMETHHSKHHQAYVTNLNKALKGSRFEKMSLEDIVLRAGVAGDAIRNNGGGHYNHSHFWKILGTGSKFDPNSEVGKAIAQTFVSFDSLKTLMNQAGATRFGAGWAWLYLTPEKKLAICSSPNQDNPIMDVSPQRGIPVLGIDVWEHAYYLKYMNKRGDYLAAIWNVINWQQVNRNYKEALASPLLKVIEKDAWAELKEFHKVMGQTFHPAEEGNLQPIRSRSGEMLAKAKTLQSGKIPPSFNTPAIKSAIDKLVKGSEALDKLVHKKKSSDKAVTESLTKLHDVFHEIQGLCND